MRFSLRYFVLWLVIVLLMLALFTLFQDSGSRRPPPDIAFSQLLDDVDQGKVRAVVMQGSEIEAIYPDGRNLKTYAPSDPTLVQRLHAKGITISARPPSTEPWFVSLIGSWLPFIALIGVWIYLARRLRAAGAGPFSFGKGIALSPVRDDPEHWRDCAREARAAAGRIGDPQSERQMLEIVRGYEYLAQRAEERMRGSDHPN
jgi:cell division protease FtsH